MGTASLMATKSTEPPHDEFCELVESKTQQPDNTTAGLAIFSQWVKSRTHKLSQDMRKIKSKSINILSQCTDQNKN